MHTDIVRLLVCALVLLATIVASVPSASAQAWVLPERTGAVTLVVQEIDHVGRMRNDGSRAAVGKAVNVGVDVELDYAFTNRFSISTSLPYVVSKFTDPNPPPSFLPFPAIDACRCWHGSFADVGVTSRYNLVDVNRTFMVTPSVSLGVPSHDYEYVGEAVVGRRLTELRLGVDAGQRLDWLRAGLSVQGAYRYTIVRRVLEIPNNRSNGSLQAGMAFPRGFSARSIVSWQRTHGGLRFPAEVNVPEAPERLSEFHRILRDNYLHAGGGVSYSRGVWDLAGSFLLTARGTNAHDIHVFTFTLSRAFELGAR